MSVAVQLRVFDIFLVAHTMATSLHVEVLVASCQLQALRQLLHHPSRDEVTCLLVVVGVVLDPSPETQSQRHLLWMQWTYRLRPSGACAP